MDVKFTCACNSVHGMRAHAKLGSGHVIEMSACSSWALSTSSRNFYEISTWLCCFKLPNKQNHRISQLFLISETLVLRIECHPCSSASSPWSRNFFQISSFGQNLQVFVGKRLHKSGHLHIAPLLPQLVSYSDSTANFDKRHGQIPKPDGHGQNLTKSSERTGLICKKV